MNHGWCNTVCVTHLCLCITKSPLYDDKMITLLEVLHVNHVTNSDYSHYSVCNSLLIKLSKFETHAAMYVTWSNST